MSSPGQLSASPISAQSKAQSSEVNIDIYAYIFVDGLANLDTQSKRKEVLEKGIQIIHTKDADSGYVISRWNNPTSPKDNGSSIEDELHVHVPFFLDIEYGLLTINTMLMKSQNLKNDISNFVEKYILDDNVKSIKIHFLILMYNQLDPFISFVNPIFSLNNTQLQQKYIKRVFIDRKFLNNGKIKYKDVETFVSINPFGMSDGNDLPTFITNSLDYKKIIKDDDEPLKKDNNTPENEDIQDAAVLCQVTYDSQTAIDRSVPDFLFGVVTDGLSKVKDATAMVIRNVLTKENMDIITKDTLLNFDTKESSALSISVIMSTLGDVFNDLSAIGMVQTGLPSPFYGKILTIVKTIPDYISRAKDVTINSLNNIQKEVLQSVKKHYDKKLEEERLKEQQTYSGIVIYHSKNGFGLANNNEKSKDEITRSIYDEVTGEDLRRLLGCGLMKLMIDHRTGFYSKLYKKRGENRYFYCTAGTNVVSLNDWYNNFTQGLIGLSDQYTLSVTIAKALDKVLKGSILFFIGHSLGGGLASNNSLVTTNRHAITFNAAGLNFLRVKMTLFINNRKDLFHPKRRKSKIHAYIIDGEILNRALSKIGEGAYGTQYIIKEGEEKEDLWQLHSLGRHSIEDTFLRLKRMGELDIANTMSSH